ncbi:MAG: hypothetical protein WC875_03280 [Candidatus Absconditabacterales bacterium]
MKGTEKILLLDNDQITANDFKGIFQHNNFNVDILKNLDDLTVSLKRETYDVLVCECVFTKPKNMDEHFFHTELGRGLDCEKFIISEVEKLQPDLPILFCTTKPDKSLIDGMRASDAYIKKPTTVIDVVNQIKAILSAKKANN